VDGQWTYCHRLVDGETFQVHIPTGAAAVVATRFDVGEEIVQIARIT
jgi:hypothetical protein